MKDLRSCPLTPKRRLFDICLMLLMFIIMASNEFWINEKKIKLTKRNIHKIAIEQARRTHLAVIDKYMKYRENWTTSALGSWLFKFNATIKPQQRPFIVYVPTEIFRSIRAYHLSDCSVKNCFFTNYDALLPVVDAVLVDLRLGLMPNRSRGNQRQRWIFMSTESPVFTYVGSKRIFALKDLVNVFNWSLSYRTISDIPFPYGRTLPLEEPLFTNYDLSDLAETIPNWKRKRRDVLVNIMMSRCLSTRLNFVASLQKYNITVDMYGDCSTNKTLARSCPFTGDCDQLSAYLFYLALENSQCQEYLTEKVWHNAYMKGAIPIIMGPPLSDCERLLPPNSYIFVPKKFNNTVIEELAEQIKKLNEDDDALLSLHKWRNHFKVTFEHDSFGSKSILFCRICEGLNYNNQEIKIYDEKNIKSFLDKKILCQL